MPRVNVREIDPARYARVTRETASKVRQRHDDGTIMPLL